MSIKSKITAAAAVCTVFAVGATGLGGTLYTSGITASADSAYSVKAVSVSKPVIKTGYTAAERSIQISWNKVSGADGYYIYRYGENCPRWLNVGKTDSKTVSFKSDALPGLKYKFKIKAYKLVNGKKVFSDYSSEIKTVSKPGQCIIISASKTNSSVTLIWNKLSGTGYEIFMREKGSSDWKKAKTITDKNVNTYKIGNLYAGASYEFMVRSTAVDENGKKAYGTYSTIRTVKTTGVSFNYVPSASKFLSRLNSATTTSTRKSYKLYNRQGKKTVTTTEYLSSADIQTLKRFADEHFTSSMTKGEKVDYTLQWINKNVVYADGKNGHPQYSDIWAKSYVDAVFNSRAGQCVQYNGALVAMMCYLGYDANLVQGYRGYENGSQWQHFWGEVKIGSTSYLMECGNYGQDGDWYYCCVKYSESNPWGGASYIMNGKAADK